MNQPGPARMSLTKCDDVTMKARVLVVDDDPAALASELACARTADPARCARHEDALARKAGLHGWRLRPGDQVGAQNGRKMRLP